MSRFGRVSVRAEQARERGDRMSVILITGGACQGQAEFAKKLAEESGKHDGAEAGAENSWVVVEDIHLLIAEQLRQKKDPWKEICSLTEQYPHLILTVNELGCGIVPVDAFDRAWREMTGRICCELAKQAQAVYRLICGIPAKLK